MKAAQSKIVVTFASLALVLPFIAIAAFIATRAVGGTESQEQGLLLLGLAMCGALAGFVGGASRERAGAAREASVLHITARERRARQGSHVNAR